MMVHLIIAVVLPYVRSYFSLRLFYVVKHVKCCTMLNKFTEFVTDLFPDFVLKTE